MDRSEVIRLARGAADATGTLIPAEWNDLFLERFAALVAAHEREACIDIVAMHGGSVEIEAAIRARSKE